MIDYLVKNNFMVMREGEKFQLDNFFYLRKFEKGVVVRKPATMLVYNHPVNNKPAANIHLLRYPDGKEVNVHIPHIDTSNAVCRFKEYVFGTLNPMEISVRMPRLFVELRMEGFVTRNI